MDEYLVEASELYKLIQHNQVKLIDTRDEHAYQLGHIAGAVNIHDIFTYLCTPENGGLKGLQGHFEKLLGQAGISRTDPVVIYEDAMDNGYGQSCRGWVLLRYLGHAQVTVLHGGLQAWKAASLPLSQEQVLIKPVAYGAVVQDGYMVTAEQVKAAIGDPTTVILDNRDYAEWLGANSSPYGYDYCPRKGRIPGAVWIEWYRLMTRVHGIPWLRDPGEVLRICKKVGINKKSKVFIYCFKGARGSNTLIAMRRAGILNTQLYFASWNEWSRIPELPVDEGYPPN